MNALRQVVEQEMHAVAQDPDQPRIRPQMLEFLNPRLAVVVEVDGDSQSLEPEALYADPAP